MELTPDIVDYCENRFKWDDDTRQEVYVKVLEAPDGTKINKGWLVRVYENARTDQHRQVSNQARLREENYDAIVQNLALGSPEDDPADLYVVMDTIRERIDGLSPLLAATLEEVVIEGMTPEEVAEANNEDVWAVRKRLERARNTLQGK